MIVSTTSGRIQGYVDDGVMNFRGVPFAASTGGARRFLPPAPPPSWDGVRPCVENGPVCPQASVSSERYAVVGERSEDCLNLNVWTTGVEDEPKPVLIFFHGGGYMSGAGSVAVYDCSKYAKRGMVCVTANYRLAQLGFLYLDELFPDLQSTANLGLLDAQRSLEWIAENIAAFGGDPNRVTISGSSAGGGVVVHLMGMPTARPLFQRAIPLSIGSRNERGPAGAARLQKTGTATAAALIDYLGVKPGDTDALRAVPIEKLAPGSGLYGLFAEIGVAPQTSPVPGDPFLPIPPRDAIAQGDAVGIDLMTGCAQEEFGGRRTYAVPAAEVLGIQDVPMPRPRPGAPLDLAEFVDTSLFSVADFTARYAESLAAAGVPNEPVDIYLAALSEATMTKATTELAIEHGAHHGNSWLFRFKWPSPAYDNALGSFHGVMTPFFFDNLDNAAWARVIGDAAPQSIADELTASTIAFAATGDPANPTIPTWPVATEGGRPTLVFDETTTLQSNPDGDRLALYGL
jgi:para-nitrobenzyl esterase